MTTDLEASKLLRHPVFLGALGVLVVNDHVLKPRYPSVLTGKLSDLAGLVVAPIVVFALLSARTRARRPQQPILAWSCAVVAFCFGLTKVSAFAEAVYEVVGGYVSWPVRAILQGQLDTPTRGAMVRDVTDLVALPMALVPVLIQHLERLAQQRTTQHSTATPT